MAQRGIVYAYPQWHTVSFTLVAKKHIEQLRKYTKVYEWDETTIPDIYVTTPFVLCIHPTIGAVWRWLQQTSWIESNLDAALDSLSGRLRKFEKVVGFEVADSDAVSELAIKLLAPVDEVCVPSEWSRQSSSAAAAKNRCTSVPHGLDREWYTHRQPTHLRSETKLCKCFIDINSIITRSCLTFWLWHFPRKKRLRRSSAVLREAAKRERRRGAGDQDARSPEPRRATRVSVEHRERLGVVR
jgi:hypothetical protein